MSTATYPQRVGSGLEWACCTSSIGPVCLHKAATQLDTDIEMVAVTVAFTVPAGFGPHNWPHFIAALIRSHFNSYPHLDNYDNNVRVLDSWRADR